MTSGTYQIYKEELIQQAIKKYDKILPVKNSFSLSADESFTIFDTNGKVRIVFWFNTEDNSTHVIQKEILN